MAKDPLASNQSRKPPERKAERSLPVVPVLPELPPLPPLVPPSKIALDKTLSDKADQPSSNLSKPSTNESPVQPSNFLKVVVQLVKDLFKR